VSGPWKTSRRGPLWIANRRQAWTRAVYPYPLRLLKSRMAARPVAAWIDGPPRLPQHSNPAGNITFSTSFVAVPEGATSPSHAIPSPCRPIPPLSRHRDMDRGADRSEQRASVRSPRQAWQRPLAVNAVGPMRQETSGHSAGRCAAFGCGLGRQPVARSTSAAARKSALVPLLSTSNHLAM
jgi:hypothetical protein